MNLNQVSLPVKNMEEGVRFYLTLGFIQIVDTPHYARFACPKGESTFSLVLDEKFLDERLLDERLLDERLLDEKLFDPQKGETGVVIYFEEEKLDQWVEELEKKGIQFESQPQDMRYLWREAVLKDPSGNKIKLFWAGEHRLNPPWKVDIRG